MYQFLQNLSFEENSLASRPLLGEAFVKIRKQILQPESGYRGKENANLVVVSFVGGLTYASEKAILISSELKIKFNAKILVLSTFPSEPKELKELKTISSDPDKYFTELDLEKLAESNTILQISEYIVNKFDESGINQILPMCQQKSENLHTPNWVKFEEQVQGKKSAVTIYWQKVVDVQKYQVSVLQKIENQQVIFTSKVVENFEILIVENLMPGKQYDVQVQVFRPNLKQITTENYVDVAGQSDNFASFWTTPLAPKEVDVSSVPSNITDPALLNKVKIKIGTGDTVDQNVKYKVVFKSNFQNYYLDYFTGDVEKFIYLPLQKQQKYELQVNQLNQNKISLPESKTFQIENFSLPNYLPTMLQIFNISKTSLTVKFPTNSLAEQYVIKLENKFNGNEVYKNYLQHSNSATFLQERIENLIPGTGYLLDIQLINDFYDENSLSSGLKKKLEVFTIPAQPDKIELFDLTASSITIKLFQAAEGSSQEYVIELYGKNSEFSTKNVTENQKTLIETVTIPHSYHYGYYKIKFDENILPGNIYEITAYSLVSTNLTSDIISLSVTSLPAPVDNNSINVVNSELTSYELMFQPVKAAEVYLLCNEIYNARSNEVEECTTDLIEMDTIGG